MLCWRMGLKSLPTGRLLPSRYCHLRGPCGSTPALPPAAPSTGRAYGPSRCRWVAPPASSQAWQVSQAAHETCKHLGVQRQQHRIRAKQ